MCPCPCSPVLEKMTIGVEEGKLLPEASPSVASRSILFRLWSIKGEDHLKAAPLHDSTSVGTLEVGMKVCPSAGRDAPRASRDGGSRVLTPLSRDFGPSLRSNLGILRATPSIRPWVLQFLQPEFCVDPARSDRLVIVRTAPRCTWTRLSPVRRVSFPPCCPSRFPMCRAIERTRGWRRRAWCL